MKFEGWSISFDALLQIAGFIAVMVGIYWRTRELIFKLHNENQTHMSAMEAKLNMLYEWWQNYIERRNNNH